MELQRLALSLHSKEVPGSTPLGQGLFLVCLHDLSMSTWVLSGYSVVLGDSNLNMGMIVSVCLYVTPVVSWWMIKSEGLKAAWHALWEWKHFHTFYAFF